MRSYPAGLALLVLVGCPARQPMPTPSADGGNDAHADSGSHDGWADVGEAGQEPDGAEPLGSAELCSDRCSSARNGECEDGGEGSSSHRCLYGRDCTDCGSRDPSSCVPLCEEGWQCGSDGCGGACGPGCDPGLDCGLGGVCVDWVVLVGGSRFVMGAPEGEVGRQRLVEVEHEVRLSRDVLILAREVSQAWYLTVTGDNPSTDLDCGASCPVETVTWGQAAAFSNELSRGEGLEMCYSCAGQSLGCSMSEGLASPYECEGYRLPTEAEWEHAARGGTTSATYNGDLLEAQLECEAPNETLDPIAWFCGNASGPQEVGQLEPNAFGLFDALGNVREHTHDWYDPYVEEAQVDPWGLNSGSHRTCRGGSYATGAASARAAFRHHVEPGESYPDLGFRVARTLR